MARTGGRAARWAVGASAAAATALFATGVLALTPEDPAVRSAAVDAAAPGTTAGTGRPIAPGTTAPPSSAVPADPAASSSPTAPGGSPTSSASTSTPTSAPASAPSSAPSTAPSTAPTTSAGASAAAEPSTAIVSPSLALPEYPTWPGATTDAPFVSFIGDSWTYGTGATDRVGYAYLTGRLLGWTHRVLGVGGSGYVRDGAGRPFDDRIVPAVSGNPDVVVIQGSINERDTPVEELAPAAARTLGRLVRAAGPDTTVVVLGASYVPGVPDAKVDRVNDTVRAAAGRLGLPFVDVAAENWSDPADPAVWADRAHVNDAGAQQIAERLAPVLQTVLAG